MYADAAGFRAGREMGLSGMRGTLCDGRGGTRHTLTDGRIRFNVALKNETNTVPMATAGTKWY